MDNSVIQFFQQFVTPYILSISAGLTAAGIRTLLEGVDFSRVRRNFPVDVLEEAMTTLAGDDLVPEGLTWTEIAQKICSELGLEDRATSMVLCSPQHFDKAVAAVLSSAGVPTTDDYLDQLKKLIIVNVLRHVAEDQALAPEVTVDILIALWQKISDVDKFLEDLRGDLTRIVVFQSIEAALAKKHKNTPDFFREAGPLWTDFDARLVAPRSADMRRIVQSISEGSRCCYVIGPSGSGKTVLAKQLGYDLSHEGWFVFYARATIIALVDLWREIARWDRKQFLFIVDDCEDNPDLAYEILARFPESENCALLLLSRVSPEDLTESGLPFTQLIPVDVTPTRQVVANVVATCERYLSQVESYDPREIHKPNEEDVKALWRLCGPDLWIVKWFLRSWDPRKSQLRSVSKDQVYRRIVEQRLKFAGERSILLAVSALSQIGIKTVERYLCAKGSPEDIEELVRRGVLTRDLSTAGFVYGVHHPSPARLYLEAAARFGTLPNGLEPKSGLSEKVQHYVRFVAHEYLSNNTSQLPYAVRGLRRNRLDELIMELLDSRVQQLAFMDELVNQTNNMQRNIFGDLLGLRPQRDAAGSFAGKSLPETFARIAQARHTSLVPRLVEVLLRFVPRTEQGSRLAAFLQLLPPSVHPRWVDRTGPYLFKRLYQAVKKANGQIAQELSEAWLCDLGEGRFLTDNVRTILEVYLVIQELEGTSAGYADRYLKRITEVVPPSALARSAISRLYDLLVLLPKLYKVNASYRDAVMKNIGADRLKELLAHRDVNTLWQVIRYLPHESQIVLWEALGIEGRKRVVANSTPAQAAHGIRWLAEVQPDWAQELLEQSVDHFLKEGEPPLSIFEMQSFVWAATEAGLHLPNQILTALASDRYRDKLAEAELRELGLLMHHLQTCSPRTYERIANQLSQLDLGPATSAATLHDVNGFLMAMRGASERIKYTVGMQVAHADILAALKEASLRDMQLLIYDCLRLSEEVATAVTNKWISVPLIKSKEANAPLEQLFWTVWNTYQASPGIATELVSDGQIAARIRAELSDSSSWFPGPTVGMALVGLLDLFSDDFDPRIELPEDVPISEIAQWISTASDPSLIALSIIALHARISSATWCQFAATVDCQVMEELLSTPPSIRAREIFDKALGLLCASMNSPKS